MAGEGEAAGTEALIGPWMVAPARVLNPLTPPGARRTLGSGPVAIAGYRSEENRDMPPRRKPAEEKKYDGFRPGRDSNHGPEQGFNRWIRLNDPDLFTAAAKKDPVVQAFLGAPFSVNFAQFKSSTRESEYFIHKPTLAMRNGGVEGIEGGVHGFPARPRVTTLVLNHERTLARAITKALVIEDGAQAGQLIYKQRSETKA
jgi:hypothetical protein